jgi:hypothetical protein
MAVILILSATTSLAQAQSLRGSPSSLDRQNRAARQQDYTFLTRASELERFVGAGLLVPLDGDAPYRLHDVSFNVARPEVKLFVERLSPLIIARLAAGTAPRTRAARRPPRVRARARPRTAR